MRFAAKRDVTEPAIVRALEAAGWTVLKISDTGLPDLLCMRRGVVRFLECKSPGGTLTPAQTTAFQRFAAALVTVHVVRTPEEALMTVGAPVEGVLEPLPPAASAGASTIAARLNVNPNRTHDHIATGNYIITQPLKTAPHLVTPEFQREQTKAVVPRRRKKT